MAIGDPPSDVDFLAWFGEDEREVCRDCGERASVTMPEVRASFCLRCGAITIDGERIDVDRRLPDLAGRLTRSVGRLTRRRVHPRRKLGRQPD